MRYQFNWAVLPFWGLFGTVGYLIGHTTGCLVALAIAFGINVVVAVLPD